MHRSYPEESNRIQLTDLILTGKLHTYLAGLNEQAQERYLLVVKQMVKAEGVTEDLKQRFQLDWVRVMNGIARPCGGNHQKRDDLCVKWLDSDGKGWTFHKNLL